MVAATTSPIELHRKRKVHTATIGLLLAWVSGLTAVTQGIYNSVITSAAMQAQPNIAIVSIICSIMILALNDILAGIFTIGYNVAHGKGFKEHKRMCKLRISWMMLLAAVFAGPFATGCWMSSVSFCGITYTTIIMSLTPICTAIVGRIVFKESTTARIYLGIIIAIAGSIVAGWAGAPEGITNFYLGIALAACAPIGFTVEGMASTYAADIIDPLVGCGFFRGLLSGVAGLMIVGILAAATGYLQIVASVVILIATTPYLLICLLLMGVLAAISYGTTYVAFNKAGPTRTLAVVNSMPVWSIPLGFLFAALGVADYTVTPLGIIGAVVVVVGLILVVCKPSELFNLRNVS